jgi:hypothetical protein
MGLMNVGWASSINKASPFFFSQKGNKKSSYRNKRINKFE